MFVEYKKDKYINVSKIISLKEDNGKFYFRYYDEANRVYEENSILESSFRHLVGGAV